MRNVHQKIYGDFPDAYTGFNTTSVDMQGWASTSPWFKTVIERFRPSLIVEVGTWKGGSAIHMAGVCKQLYQHNMFEIVCIDTFLGSFENWNNWEVKNWGHFPILHGRPQLYETFLTNVLHNNHQDVISPLPLDSYNAFKVLQHYGVQADMLYIDGGHDYDQVKKDLENYVKILKTGGILLGDDAFHEPIARACNELLPGWSKVDEKFIWIKQ